ncbi:amidohydrolase family protein [Geobacter sp. SVR]|uniref:amidohydrolase family protein n=1 Tax=Geobacter sp. SVR TaxID=2495594 RepID=UPI00143EFC05|nr:amidohydrolase family protein [Geobacter sp. SVR]BCS55875.1 metal-dependent hydrolase [Geobacter sp. SVR]GCF83879.1 metal-dependent hydrolase [Geobacter sp. SVR]
MIQQTRKNDAFIAAASWLISPTYPIVPGGAILVQDGIVGALGKRDDLKKLYDVPVIEYPGCAILPGLINAHTHLELTHFPSWLLRTHVEYSPRRFVDWVIQLIKIKRGLENIDFRKSLAEGVRICLESGTTAVGEIVSDFSMAPAYRATPLGGRLYFELLGHDPVRFQHLLEDAVTACQSDGPRYITSGLSPHSVYTIGEEHLHTIRRTAHAKQLPLVIHLSESKSEADFVFDSAGPLAQELYPFVGWERYLTAPRRCSSTELLERAGLLTADTLAVHCVHLTLGDAKILKQHGVKVVICPRSNELLDVGHAPVALFKSLGIPLALGTDSLASNNTLSLWDEIRFTLNSFSKELSPTDVFHMATVGGATALGIEKAHGSLEPGKYANFQILRLPGKAPASGKLLENIIYEGVVDDVFVMGRQYASSKTDIIDMAASTEALP